MPSTHALSAGGGGRARPPPPPPPPRPAGAAPPRRAGAPRHGPAETAPERRAGAPADLLTQPRNVRDDLRRLVWARRDGAVADQLRTAGRLADNSDEVAQGDRLA